MIWIIAIKKNVLNECIFLFINQFLTSMDRSLWGETISPLVGWIRESRQNNRPTLLTQFSFLAVVNL
ncbi:hypothetical protein [Leptospira stimsonii]|uniref:hypothetical protein n=1 Tax=Leptospira stimsonii TaxID=2202203 RepID=UPI0014386275|nr:hypothetical protein [Leptospira stimsonii]